MQREQHARAFKRKYRNRFKVAIDRPILCLLFFIIRSFDTVASYHRTLLRAATEQRLQFQFDYTTRQHPISSSLDVI